MTEQQVSGGGENNLPAPTILPASDQEPGDLPDLEDLSRRLADCGAPFDTAVLSVTRIRYRPLNRDGKPTTSREQYGILAKDEFNSAYIGGFPTLTMLNDWIEKHGSILSAVRTDVFNDLDHDILGTDNYVGPAWLSDEALAEMRQAELEQVSEQNFEGRGAENDDDDEDFEDWSAQQKAAILPDSLPSDSHRSFGAAAN